MCSADKFAHRRQKCFETIETIQTKKSEIAETLRQLGVQEAHEDREVKFAIDQLMTAYDSISMQEKRWMDLLKEIDEMEKAEIGDK